MNDFATNPKARFDYEILDTLEAGLVLEGQEVKSVRKNQASIKGSYVKIIGGEGFLIGATISPYQPENLNYKYDPQRTRKLLLSKKELLDLSARADSSGTTLVPIKLYGKRNRIKLLVGIARGKKKYDKRETIKKKDIARARQRGLQQ